jgi:hypothetical protein
VRRIGQDVAAAFVLLGIFWAGRESDHGFGAFWDHWWCPLPLVAVVLGVAGVLATRFVRRPPAHVDR